MHGLASSMLIAYAKGARTFERHIDIDGDGGAKFSLLVRCRNSDSWFKAFHKAKEMCGAPGTQKRMPPQKEIAVSGFAGARVYLTPICRKDILFRTRTCILRFPCSRARFPAAS